MPTGADLGPCRAVEFLAWFFARKQRPMVDSGHWAWPAVPPPPPPLMECFCRRCFIQGIPVVRQARQNSIRRAFSLLAGTDPNGLHAADSAEDYCAGPRGRSKRFGYSMRSVASGTSGLGDEMLEWAARLSA